MFVCGQLETIRVTLFCTLSDGDETMWHSFMSTLKENNLKYMLTEHGFNNESLLIWSFTFAADMLLTFFGM